MERGKGPEKEHGMGVGHGKGIGRGVQEGGRSQGMQSGPRQDRRTNVKALQYLKLIKLRSSKIYQEAVELHSWIEKSKYESVILKCT